MRLSPALCSLILLPLAACSGPKTQTAALDAQARRLLAELPPDYRGADVAQGKLVFNTCRACHVALEGGAVLVGPNLYGLWGAKAGGARRIRLFRRAEGHRLDVGRGAARRVAGRSPHALFPARR